MTEDRNRRFLGIPDTFWIGFVIMIGFFLKVIYDVEAGYTVSTHDLGEWTYLAEGDAHGGVIGVIQYYFMRHRLPDVNPVTVRSYAEAPFYYIVCSLLLELLHRLMHLDIGSCLHLLQCLNVVYVTVGSFMALGILRKLGVKGRQFVMSVIFLTFFPGFYHLSANLCPDAMLFMFMMLAFAAALSYYRTRLRADVMKAAVYLALAFLTKRGAVVVLPVLVSLFAACFADGRTDRGQLRRDMGRFALITAPAALAYPLYLAVRFKVNPFVIPDYGSGQRVSKLSTVAMRIGLPRMENFTYLHTTRQLPTLTNVWAQLMKTALFDETALTLSTGASVKMARVFLYMSIAICLLFHLMWLLAAVSGRYPRHVRRAMLAGYLGTLAMYVIYALKVPFISAMNYRYISIACVFPLVGAALFGSGKAEASFAERFLLKLAHRLVFVFAALTAFLFGFYY